MWRTEPLLNSGVRFWGRVLLGLFCLSADAKSPVEEWTEMGRTFLEGKVPGTNKTITVYAPDAPIDMPKCRELEAFVPLGAKLQGNTLVGVRCLAPKPWTLHFKAKIDIIGRYLTTHHALALGHVIDDSDIEVHDGNINEIPANAVIDQKELVGQVVATGLGAGHIWRRDHLRPRYVVESGQTIQIKVIGTGFQVTGEGVALASGIEGQRIQIRTPKGGLLTGVAHAGAWVELKL